MKKLLVMVLTIAALSGCQSKDDYKVVRTEVMDIHDKVMVYTDLAMKKKMSLDSLSNTMDSLVKTDLRDTAAAKQEIAALKKELDQAGEKMDDWMHQFEPEIDGKTKEEALTYFKSEKIKIQALDSLYQRVLNKTNQSLAKFNR